VNYRPAQCNIGRRGRRRRAAGAVCGFAVAAALVVGHAVGALPAVFLVAAFVPLALGVEFAVQASTAFCVGLAALGRFDFSGEGGPAGRVADPADRGTDRIHALKISVVSVALAAVTTGVLVVVL
jgi:hypothetical protein